jgi:hypothetical protein
MTKKQYREFCTSSGAVPVFSTPFWLDAVSESWDIATYSEKGKLLGVLPYSLKGNVLTKRIYIPELTAYSGPVLFCPENLNEYDTRSFEKKVISNLLEQLPDKLYKSSIKCYPAIDNWLPFCWQGFKQNTRYTYLLDTSPSREKIFANFKEAHQRQIRKAEKATLQIEQCANVPMLFELFSKTFERQGMKTPFSRSHFEKIYTAVKEQHSGEIFVAKNKNGQLLAAMFIVWDATSMYYLLGYFDEQESNSGAMTYLFWHCILLAKVKNIQFNFEGSMIESIEQYFRGFGGKLTPVHFISK